MPVVSVITNVAMDHMQYLGNTLQEIAREKAGIIKEGIPVVTAAQHVALKELKKDATIKKHAFIFTAVILKSIQETNGSRARS